MCVCACVCVRESHRRRTSRLTAIKHFPFLSLSPAVSVFVLDVAFARGYVLECAHVLGMVVAYIGIHICRNAICPLISPLIPPPPFSHTNSGLR